MWFAHLSLNTEKIGLKLRHDPRREHVGLIGCLWQVTGCAGVHRWNDGHTERIEGHLLGLFDAKTTVRELDV